MKIGGELSGANCPGGKLSGYPCNTPVIFYRIANREEFVSFLVYCLEKKTLFCRTISPVIITLRKVFKEIHNIVVSHLFTLAVFRVFAVQCEM